MFMSKLDTHLLYQYVVRCRGFVQKMAQKDK